jgi:hypothetical protein
MEDPPRVGYERTGKSVSTVIVTALGRHASGCAPAGSKQRLDAMTWRITARRFYETPLRT